MKNLFLALIIVLPTSVCTAKEPDNFQIIIKPTWQDLECNTQSCIKFGSKWILVGSITFKKKSKEPVCLGRLYLKWVGDYLDNLVGSLYTKHNETDFMPIEDQLVCDSEWNKKDQTLSLRFNDQQMLGFMNTYYLVLTVHPHLESIIKQGHFKLDHLRLPEQFKWCSQDNHLCLQLNALESTIEEVTL